MYKATSVCGFEVTGLNIEGIRRLLKAEGISEYLTNRSFYAPRQVGSWVIQLAA